MVRERNGLLVVLMAGAPIVAMQVGVGFLRFQAHRKRGVRAFRKALARAGMPREQAAHLAQLYHEAGSVRKILQGTGVPRF